MANKSGGFTNFFDADGSVRAALEDYLAEQKKLFPGMPLSISYVARIAVMEGLKSIAGKQNPKLQDKQTRGTLRK